MESQSNQSALVLFCKQPRLGYGKQRLAATIGRQKALLIAEALLNCALEDAASWPGTLIVSPTAPDESEWVNSLKCRPALAGTGAMFWTQCAGNLGTRLANMDTRVRETGVDRVVFVGSDAPALTMAHFNTVIRELDDYDVVLADCVDGGVTLMASRSGWPALEELPWSTTRLGNTLASACIESGRSVVRFDGTLDLDEERDIEPLLCRLTNDRRPMRRALVATLR